MFGGRRRVSRKPSPHLFRPENISTTGETDYRRPNTNTAVTFRARRLREYYRTVSSDDLLKNGTNCRPNTVGVCIPVDNTDRAAANVKRIRKNERRYFHRSERIARDVRPTPPAFGVHWPDRMENGGAYINCFRVLLPGRGEGEVLSNLSYERFL